MDYKNSLSNYPHGNVIKNKKYYYRFFVYDTNKLCNNNINMIIENTFYGVDPILKNNTWEQINAASEAGIASSIWNIGDEIDITFTKSGSTHNSNVTYTFQIWDFNHFDKSDGSGKAGICFGMKNLSSEAMYYGSGINNDKRQWEDCDLRRYLNGGSDYSSTVSDYSAFPDDCKKYIKSVDVYTGKAGYEYNVYDGVIKTIDKLFLPGSYELGMEYYDDENINTEKMNLWRKYQTIFPIFTDNNSRIKRSENGTGDPSVWITRTPDPYKAYGIVYGVNKDGSKGAREYMDSTYGTARCVCYCFNI